MNLRVIHMIHLIIKVPVVNSSYLPEKLILYNHVNYINPKTDSSCSFCLAEFTKKAHETMSDKQEAEKTWNGREIKADGQVELQLKGSSSVG